MAKARILLALWLAAFGSAAQAQSDTASARLAAWLPELFEGAGLADAAVGGEFGARLTLVTESQRAFGLQVDDVILAVDGVSLGQRGAPAIPAGAPVLTVWRPVPGQRPVLDPAILGRQVLDEFAELPEAERAPMRLACMLANQSTLVNQGGGITLVPGPATFDAGLWLRHANPLPQGSEAALRGVADGVEHRTRLTRASEGEAARAADLQRRGQYLEAQERARRAMVQAVVDPAARADGTGLAAATRTYLEATESLRLQAAAFAKPEALFGLVAEGMLARIDAFLPQNTLLDVEASTGWAFALGVRVRFPIDGVPVLSNSFLLVEYGQVRNGFDAPGGGGEVLATTLQQYTFEVLYRPRVASRLRPFVRGGVGIYPLTGRVHCPEGVQTAFTDTNVGGVFGGGIDFLHLRAQHLRGSIVGTYRIVHAAFDPDSAPLIQDCARNSPPDLVLDPQEPYYQFDMDGWQVGMMLTLEL